MMTEPDDLTGYEEHLDFERFAEDMEQRARRLQAEREAELEAEWDAYYEQREAAVRDGGDL